jgi:hypothetical protein
MAQCQRVVVSCCFTAAATALILYLVAVSTNRRSASINRGSSIANASQDNQERGPYPEVGSFPWEPASKDRKPILSSSEQKSSTRDVKEFLSSMTFVSNGGLRKPSCPCCT